MGGRRGGVGGGVMGDLCMCEIRGVLSRIPNNKCVVFLGFFFFVCL